jgi:WD40 repeat protein
MRSSWLILAALVLGGGAGAMASGQGAIAQGLCPAYLRQAGPRFTLFPLDGPEAMVALPAGLPGNFRVITFGPDGKAIYGQVVEPLGRQVGITEIEFQPPRQHVLPGSAALSKVAHMAVSLSSGRVFVAGWTASLCGYFEIDPSAGVLHTLRAGPSVDCGRALGPVSPDGKYAVSASGNQLGLLDLVTGAFQAIKGMTEVGPCTWSPDGKLLACIRDGRIAVVDIITSQVRNIGGSGNGRAEWSPDSKSLLVFRDELSCKPTLYGASLAVVDVKTGQRSWVKSAHCNITGGSYYGWVDREAIK